MAFPPGTAFMRGDAYNFERSYPAAQCASFGYVIDTGSTTVYHAGDTIPYDELAGQLRQHDVGVAFLPINGRDKRREFLDIVGNLSPKEAAQLARSAGGSRSSSQCTSTCSLRTWAARTS